MDKKAWRPMDTLIVRGNSARRAFNNDKHVVRDEPVIIIKRKPRGASLPAAALETRGKHMVKCCGTFGRAVGEARRPVCPRKLAVGVLKSQVNDADHRGARIWELAAPSDGRKFVVVDSCSSSMELPLRTGYNVEVTRGYAPAREHDVSDDGSERLPLAVASMRAIGSNKSHGGRISGTTLMAEVESDRHGFRIKVRRSIGARVTLEPRKKDAASRT
jgi:hypothetical protein